MIDRIEIEFITFIEIPFFPFFFPNLLILQRSPRTDEAEDKGANSNPNKLVKNSSIRFLGRRKKGSEKRNGGIEMERSMICSSRADVEPRAKTAS